VCHRSRCDFLVMSTDAVLTATRLFRVGAAKAAVGHRGHASMAACPHPGWMSLLIIVVKRVWSSPRTVLNCRPSPLPAITYRTVALALICPSSTRKLSSIVASTGHTFDVTRKRPPTLRSLTREVSSTRPHLQMAHTPSGVSTRLWCLLERRACFFKMRSLVHLTLASCGPQQD
jgi:hypothetical protein